MFQRDDNLCWFFFVSFWGFVLFVDFFAELHNSPVVTTVTTFSAIRLKWMILEYNPIHCHHNFPWNKVS